MTGLAFGTAGELRMARRESSGGGGRRGGVGRSWPIGFGGRQQRAGLLQFVPMGRTPQPIGTDFDQAPGQNMPQETPDKFLGAEREVFDLLGLVVAIAEGDLP